MGVGVECGTGNGSGCSGCGGCGVEVTRRGEEGERG